MMAMMMTGRVLLVCALCVLWRGVSVVAADADDCVRRGMDGVRAFGDGHRVWRRQRSAVVAGDDTTDDDSTRGSSSEVQTETETGSLDGRPPKPSVKSIPGEVPDGQDSGKISEASVPTINGTGENLDGDEEEGDVSQDESQEDRDGEDEAVDAAVGNGDRETSHTEHEEEKERVKEEKAGSTTNEREGDENNAAGRRPPQGSAASRPALPVDVSSPQNPVLGQDGAGGEKAGAGPVVLPQAAGLREAERAPAKLTPGGGAAGKETEKQNGTAEQVAAKEVQTAVEDSSAEAAAAGKDYKGEKEEENVSEAAKEESHGNVDEEAAGKNGGNATKKLQNEATDEAKTKKRNEQKEAENANNTKEEPDEEEVKKTAQEEAADKEKMGAARIPTKINTTTPENSDGSTSVSHTTSPLLLLLVVVCAAAAAVMAA
ncbi:Mucin-associated surface protein (MASP) subgroup S044 [Trypanosoma cruzi]|uniref:Mucin-associated surface protein (MASP) subgroup S044 n=1 Tax=Trypanosoma cruzi TaxID=5693 RepID=A0A7J6XIN2_TRYCR|nr:Mucin-associated surface protein (MASP) subgroup S044 [Trypanosoma cruzi]